MGTITERRLAAIMLADIAGFSALMEKDEAGTFARVRELREQLANPLISSHGGRVIKTTGDGFLAEFSSATAALRCGVELQRRNHAREADRPESERLHLRLGINVGDIIIDGEDVAGDGVNIAARLEPLAPLDGICISAAVREHVREDLGIEYDSLGDQQVKNISRPIQAYRISLTGKAGLKEEQSPRAWRRVSLGAAAAVLVLALAAGGSLFWRNGGFLSKPTIAPYSAEDRRMTFAVLPLSAPSGAPAAAAFADSATEALTANPAQNFVVRVVSRESVAQAMKQHQSARELGKALGVRFLVRGKVEPKGNGYLVAVSLVDADKDSVLKTATKDFPQDSVLHPDHHLIAGLIGSLRNGALEAEAERARRKRPEDRDARDLYFLAREAMGMEESNYAEAMGLLLKAQALAPDSWEILLQVAGTNLCDVCKWAPSERETRRKIGIEALEKFLAKNPEHPMGQFWKAENYQHMGRYADALVILDRLVEKWPRRLFYKYMRTYPSVKLGRGQNAVADIEAVLAEWNGSEQRAIAADIYYMVGRYAEAAEMARTARPEMSKQGLETPYTNDIYLVQAAAYARLGKMKEAEAVLADFRAAVPGVNTISEIKKWLDPRALLAGYEPLYEGLALAGVPK